METILWRYIENDIEGVGFKLNDIYFKEFVVKADQVSFIRHKERKFGRDCLEQWRAQQKDLLKKLEANLIPFEQMLLHRPFLLGDQPRFVDFDLFGMLENFLYSGHYQLPKRHKQIQQWHQLMTSVKHTDYKT